MLEIRNLKVAYKRDGKRYLILRGVDLSVGENETVGILGESGCGKSTLALSILRLLKRNVEFVSGSILYKGEDILRLSEEELRKIRGGEIGIIFQHPFSSLNPCMKIGKQIEEVVRLHSSVYTVSELLKTVGLKDVEKIKNSYPHELSGGMIQRCMLAIALAGDPEILIADEPTTALDKMLEKEIIDLLKELVMKKNLSLIFISHNLGLIKYLTKKVYVMYAGVVVEEGKTDEVLSSPLHPYTEVLIESYPKKGRIKYFEGDVVDIENLPGGCKFHPRCPYVFEDCKWKEPKLFLKNNRFVRCLRQEK